MSAEGNLAIAIGRPGVMQAKNIVGGSKRRRAGKGAKERTMFVLRLFEAQGGDFMSGRMDLQVIVAMDFFTQDWTRNRQVGNMFEGTGADKAVLQPAIRTFNLALGLRRESVNYIRIHQG